MGQNQVQDDQAPSLSLRIIPVTPFEQNCSLLICKQTQQAVAIDPGGDLDKIDRALKQTGASLAYVLLTHGHIDHCGQAREYADRHQVGLIGPHEDDAFWIDQLPMQGQRFGFPTLKAFKPDRWLKQGDMLSFGKQNLEVHHTPGHTPGHVVFHHRAVGLAIVGDVLFDGSIGRTDFPRGNHADLIASIQRELWPMGNDTRFVPGHGPMSSFGEQRAHNPYVSDAALG